MPGYVLQVNRVAKPGHSKEVLDAVTAQSEKSSGSRNVSISAFAPTGSGHLIVGARVLDSIEKVEEISDSVDREQADSIDIHCDNVQVEMLRIIEAGENQPSAPKFMARNLLQAKPGKAGELLSAVLELRSMFPDGVLKPLITVPYVGDQDLVRATAIYDSLKSFENHSDLLAEDTYKPYLKRIRELRESYIRHTARITFIRSS